MALHFDACRERLKSHSTRSTPIASVSTFLSPTEHAHLAERIQDENTSLSEYLRRLIRDDMRTGVSQALSALSLADLASALEEQSSQLAMLQRSFPAAVKSLAGQIELIIEFQMRAAEREQILHERLLHAYNGTADLVVTALDQCQTILDADNSILENIERRLRAGGR